MKISKMKKKSSNENLYAIGLEPFMLSPTKLFKTKFNPIIDKYCLTPEVYDSDSGYREVILNQKKVINKAVAEFKEDDHKKTLNMSYIYLHGLLITCIKDNNPKNVIALLSTYMGLLRGIFMGVINEGNMERVFMSKLDPNYLEQKKKEKEEREAVSLSDGPAIIMPSQEAKEA